ncbi:hypothetical protein O1611_g7326 [Lasiodiplodia mahajangana]|uniref:Uncharacterized protein n=1 Tax=Lasiodiplodia mahajangana TaxID=1108764 RepID=A0ACC2JG72_9PEZI|nr:hypothetical protein O1611_g7326 [Lasiodiplodia mahajangana]
MGRKGLTSGLNTPWFSNKLHDIAVVELVLGHKRLVVYEGKKSHDELAVHPVRHATVAGDGIAEVLNFESALEARSEEAAEGGYERGKGGEDNGVELHGLGGEGKVGALGQEEQHVGQQEAPDDGHDPGADEALDGLLGRELDQLGAAEGDAADVGEDVVADDERCGQEEPDHALKDVVHDEVGLDDDEVEGHP